MTLMNNETHEVTKVTLREDIENLGVEGATVPMSVLSVQFCDKILSRCLPPLFLYSTLQLGPLGCEGTSRVMSYNSLLFKVGTLN